MSKKSHQTIYETSSIITEATSKQRVASDPLISSWVGASAGSGKTKILTDRILRLLLPRSNGQSATSPEKILALTFTKAAANEMAVRLSRRLSEWAVIEEIELSKDMENLLGRPPTEKELSAARKLFARVVDTPNGMNIMTIHSFCQSVLGRFPIEAGLMPHFKTLDEGQSLELLNQARTEVLSNFGTDTLSPIAEAIKNISTLMNEEQFKNALNQFVSERHQLQQIFTRTFGVEGLYTNLLQLMKVPAGTTRESAFLDFRTCVPESALRQACGFLADSESTTDKERATNIQAFLDCTLEKSFHFYNRYKKQFINDQNEIRKYLVTKPVLARAPHIESTLLYEAERIKKFEEHLKCITCVISTRDLFLIGEVVVERYQRLKKQRGVLDFDDLIFYTLSLLKGDFKSSTGLEATQWILYKLDEGLEHILVDEAQDTNTEQWEIIRRLSDDFFNGEISSEHVRSIFVVGDEKQSIFSFQRAAPEKFWEMFRWYKQKIKDSGKKFVPVPINTSFRSVQLILDAVDTVFTAKNAGQDLADNYLHHIAKRQGQAGLVEVWPMLSTSSKSSKNTAEDIEGWFIPNKLEEIQSGSIKMANKIGDTIKSWIDKGELLEAYNRPIQPGDILVLVRSRNAFVAQLVRALKKRNIPVSGIDRMVLSEQLIVQDLMIAATFALQPYDDLALATLLKSPFVGISEEALFNFSYGRTTSLWQSIKKSGDTIIIDWLENLIQRAGAERPYEFFSYIIQEPCPANSISGLRAIRTRLGNDALDPLEEFLNSTLVYEKSHTAGLHGFLKWQQGSNSEIKRQLEGQNAVRIITIHASKGLQAPIVFLPDTVRATSGTKMDPIFLPNKTGSELPLFIYSKDAMPKALHHNLCKIEEKANEEYQRLLYVAMTRAEERLYIGGYTGKRQPAKDSRTTYWYKDIRNALENHPDIERLHSGIEDENGYDVPILRLRNDRTSPPDKVPQNKQEDHKQEAPLEDWVFRQARSESSPSRSVAPSRATKAEPAAYSPRNESEALRFKRGNITHKLMQILPDLPSDKRSMALEKFLLKSESCISKELQKDIAEEVMAILENQNFADVFGSGSIAEVPVTGYVNGQLISGQIDRMLIRDKDILIIDYKTNRLPPQNIEDVPLIYMTQMKSYADILKAIYPKHKIRCALLWTDGCKLMEIPV